MNNKKQKEKKVYQKIVKKSKYWPIVKLFSNRQKFMDKVSLISQEKLKNPPPVSHTGISATSNIELPDNGASESEVIQFLLRSIRKYHLQNPLRVTNELSDIRGKIAELNTRYKV